jgi:hypothetical protein
VKEINLKKLSEKEMGKSCEKESEKVKKKVKQFKQAHK